MSSVTREFSNVAAGAGRLLLIIAPLVVSVFAMSEVAGASYPRIVQTYCKSDYKRFCPKYKVGSSRLHRCMQANAKYLSPVCKKVLIETGLAARYGY